MSWSQSQPPGSVDEGRRRGKGGAPHSPVGLDTVDRWLGGDFVVWVVILKTHRNLCLVEAETTQGVADMHPHSQGRPRSMGLGR